MLSVEDLKSNRTLEVISKSAKKAKADKTGEEYIPPRKQ